MTNHDLTTEAGKALHTYADMVILAAAEESGLRRAVAEALAFAHKSPPPAFGCGACTLREQLTEAFDAHIGLPTSVMASVYSPGAEGFELGLPDDEVRPFFNGTATIEKNTQC